MHILSLIDGQKIYIEKEDSIKENEKLSTTKMFYDDVLYALNYVQFSCNIFFLYNSISLELLNRMIAYIYSIIL